MANLRLVLLCFSLILYSCKEKAPEVNQCSNGFKDPGESNIDCGGLCPDCPKTYNPTFFMSINGIEVSIQNRSIVQNSGNYLLSAIDDSIDLQLDLGSNGDVGNYTLNSIGQQLIYKNIQYDLVRDASHAIASNDKSAKRISGFFKLKFTRTGVPDTIYITDGQYTDLKY